MSRIGSTLMWRMWCVSSGAEAFGMSNAPGSGLDNSTSSRSMSSVRWTGAAPSGLTVPGNTLCSAGAAATAGATTTATGATVGGCVSTRLESTASGAVGVTRSRFCHHCDKSCSRAKRRCCHSSQPKASMHSSSKIPMPGNTQTGTWLAWACCNCRRRSDNLASLLEAKARKVFTSCSSSAILRLCSRVSSVGANTMAASSMSMRSEKISNGSSFKTAWPAARVAVLRCCAGVAAPLNGAGFSLRRCRVRAVLVVGSEDRTSVVNVGASAGNTAAGVTATAATADGVRLTVAGKSANST